jgi:hypothetical protein
MDADEGLKKGEHPGFVGVSRAGAGAGLKVPDSNRHGLPVYTLRPGGKSATARLIQSLSSAIYLWPHYFYSMATRRYKKHRWFPEKRERKNLLAQRFRMILFIFFLCMGKHLVEKDSGFIKRVTGSYRLGFAKSVCRNLSLIFHPVESSVIH